MTKKVWVLTREENLYDQCGEYFVHVWTHRPTEKELLAYDCTHLGREKSEDTWYNLEEINAN